MITSPDTDAFLSAFALVEAVQRRQDKDIEVLMSTASLDTMHALAMLTASVLQFQQQASGTCPLEVTDLMRRKLLGVN